MLKFDQIVDGDNISLLNLNKSTAVILITGFMKLDVGLGGAIENIEKRVIEQ